MADTTFTEEDERQIKARGITSDKVLSQIEMFKKDLRLGTLLHH
jgi:hypothetical protein